MQEVDRENLVALADFMQRHRGVPLTNDQEALYYRCKMVEEGETQDTRWEEIKSPSPDVRMSMKHFPPEEGRRNVATGKGEGVVDSSAWEVAAYFCNYCSNERIRVSKEDGNPARLILDYKAPNEAKMATIKKMPFPLLDREFVVRLVWKSDEDGVTIAVESIDEQVDYGAKMNTVRAHTQSFYRFHRLLALGDVQQCRVTCYNYLDAGGRMPTALLNRR